MPLYVYEHPKTKKTIEIVQGINEPHVYKDKKGIEWRRIFTVPQASFNTKNDEFSQSQFSDKVASTKGSLGDVWDRSAELSDKRAQRAGGVDPVKEGFYKEYSKKRRGKPHPKMNVDKEYTI